MFEKMQYVLEESEIERLKALRDTYSVKDLKGNPLGRTDPPPIWNFHIACIDHINAASNSNFR